MRSRNSTAPALAAAALLAFAAAAQAPPADVADAPANPPTTARIAPPGEPGDPIEIAGTLLAPDGKTPVAGAVVYAYHTDSTGEYRGTDERPKLRGWAKSDASGRFTFLTSRPAPYPGARAPAHVHVHVWGAGYPRQWFEVLFQGDPKLPATIPKFFQVMPAGTSAGGRQSYSATFQLQLQSNFTSR